MASRPPTCPHCGTLIVPGANFCQGCGAAVSMVVPVGAAPPPGAAPLPTSFPGPPPAPFGPPTPYAPMPPGGPGLPGVVARDRDRTVTGLLLLVIGFALSWVPYVDFIGDILAFVGIILVILGRWGYGPEHHRDVVAGGTLFVVTLLAGVGLAIGLVVALLGQVSVTGSRVSVASSALESDFLVFFVGIAVVAILGSLSRVIMVYALSDHTTRLLLWLGFVLSTVVSIAILAIVFPHIAPDVSQATSGTSVNTGPLTQLQNESTLLGLTNVFPSLVFAWAYWRAREEAGRRPYTPSY